MEELPTEMEKQRIRDLERDCENFRKYLDKQYPESLWLHYKEQAETQKSVYNNKIITSIFMILIIEGFIIYTFDGFGAGVTATVAFVLFVIYFRDMTDSEPNWEKVADPRSEDDVSTEYGLNMRLKNPEHDRDLWIKNKGYDIEEIINELREELKYE